jgi:hypothetical protein
VCPRSRSRQCWSTTRGGTSQDEPARAGRAASGLSTIDRLACSHQLAAPHHLLESPGPGRDDRLRPVLARPVQPHRRPRRHHRHPLRGGLRRPDRAGPRRLLLPGLLLRRDGAGRARGRRSQLALPAHSRRRAARAAGGGVWPMPSRMSRTNITVITPGRVGAENRVTVSDQRLRGWPT